MFNKKIFKVGIVTVLSGATTVSLASCSFTREGVLTTYSPTDYLANNNSPLNSSFNNSPISSYASSALYNLLSYQTTGKFEFSGNEHETIVKGTPKDTLILEGAKAVIVFKDKETMANFDSQKSIDLSKNDETSSDTWANKLKSTTPSTKATDTSENSLKEGENYWIFFRDKGGIQHQNGTTKDPDSTNITEYYNNAISNGKVYQFLIDTDNYWVNSNGKKMVPVSSKDFERSIESYTLASDLNYNRNGYFLDLLGLDFNDTVGYKSGENYVDVTSPNYNVENYANNNDKFFTIYINTPYPYTFGLLSKEYFAAMPHTNQKVKNISMASGTPIKTTTSNGSITINQSATDWSRIYGSGGLGQFTKDVWYAGAYYVSAFTSSQLIFELNTVYMDDTVGKKLLDWSTGKEPTNGKTAVENEHKIKTISISYGSGTSDTYYEMFKSHQNDYLSAVPSVKMSEAAKLFANKKGLVPTKIVQASQSNYIVYTPTPYVMDTSGKVTENSYMSNMAKFIYDWNSKDSVTIRAAISGLINYYQLSLLNLPGSGDFQLSATPYGVLSNYYESVANDNMNGGLPRKYSDYTSSKSDTLGNFNIPYYNYSTNDIKIENLTISKETLKNSLESYGASTSNPLQFSIKFGEGSFSTNYTNFLNKMKSAIESISDGLIKVSIVARNATTPSVTDWYNTQSSPLGFSYWSPDYNGVGTWIEASATLQSTKVGSTTYEGVPSTNSHNSFHTFLESMVTAVKKMSATWDSTSKQYVVSSSLTNGDPFENDTRIQSAFSDTTLTNLGVTLSSAKASKTTYDTSYAMQKGVKPGIRYGLLAIGLLNTLFSNKVFKTDGGSTSGKPVFQNYVDNPSLLQLTEVPTNGTQLYSGGDVFASNQSSAFSKWVGVYAGQSVEKAVYENFVVDSDYAYIPRSESGLKDITYSLVNPIYVARVGTQSVNYRDFGMSNLTNSSGN